MDINSKNKVFLIPFCSFDLKMSNLLEKYSIIKSLGTQSKRKFGAVYLVQNKLTLELAVLKSLVKTEVNFQLQARLLKEATFSFNTLGLPKNIAFLRLKMR